MYVRSRESRERDAKRKREKRAAAKLAREAVAVMVKAKEFAEEEKRRLPSHKITGRRLQPKLPPNTSKQDLRDILAEAFRNTAKMA